MKTRLKNLLILIKNMNKLKPAYGKILFAIILICSLKLKAQNTNADTLLLRSNNNQQFLPQNSTRNEIASDSLTQNKLVELALKQPKFDETQSQRNILDLQLEKAKKSVA